jgi:hypothetical protein
MLTKTVQVKRYKLTRYRHLSNETGAYVSYYLEVPWYPGVR